MNHDDRVEKGQVNTGACQNQRRLKEKVPEGASKFSFKRGSGMILGERQRGGGKEGGIQSGAFPGPHDALPLASLSLRRSVSGALCWPSFPGLEQRHRESSTHCQGTPFSKFRSAVYHGHMM